MSNSFALISSSDIDMPEFSTFIKELGGTILPEDGDAARVSRGVCHLWVFLNPEGVTEVLDDNGEAVTQVLGNPPKSCVEIEVSAKAKTEFLLIDFVISFSMRWNAILCDPYNHFFTLKDLQALKREGKGFGSALAE